MPPIENNGAGLLELVKKLPREEYDAFIETALALRPPARTSMLSAKETKLVERINRGLPLETSDRYGHLMSRRKKRSLTDDEQQELLKLTHIAESQDADRAAALLELAKLRQVSVRALMKQLGIQIPAIHG